MMNHETNESTTRLSRRTVLQWIGATAATGPLGASMSALGQSAPAPATKGYGTDPNLVKFYEPGDVWPLTFTDEQRKIVTALADTILPEDDFGPAASTVRVPDYIDEWVSAPYPNQQRDREVVMPGLTRFEEAAKAKYQKSFADLDPTERDAFCTSIVSADKHPLAGFFHKFTMIAAGAYYSTTEGWKAIGYVGNVASGVFSGPPQEVLDRVGVEQTVE
tara:strand:- start:6236 stop:6892 length:657 start_codon:yes stop_codon:yes gene_type:complete